MTGEDRFLYQHTITIRKADQTSVWKMVEAFNLIAAYRPHHSYLSIDNSEFFSISFDKTDNKRGDAHSFWRIRVILDCAEIVYDTKVFTEVERVYETIYDCINGRREAAGRGNHDFG